MLEEGGGGNKKGVGGNKKGVGVGGDKRGGGCSVSAYVCHL